MALKQCRECGRDVSSTVTKCPHCGASTVPPWATAIAAVAVVGLAWYVWTTLQPATALPAPHLRDRQFQLQQSDYSQLTKTMKWLLTSNTPITSLGSQGALKELVKTLSVRPTFH